LACCCWQVAAWKPEGFSLDTAEQPAQNSLPQGTAITLIRLSPDFPEDGTIFIGTEGHGIFRSDNEGLSWVASEDGIESLIAEDPHISSLPVLDIALSPSFAEDGEAYFASHLGIHYSNDGGRTLEAAQRYSIPPYN
jgi:hypothetical protein